MANGYNLRTRVRVRTTLKNVLTFGGLGMATGVVVCAGILFTGQTFNSETTRAGNVHATVSQPQDLCTGDSVRLEATGGDVYRWSPQEGLSDPFAAATFASPKATTAYTATVYRFTGWPLRQSGMMPVTATLLNSKEKTLQRVSASVKPGSTYMITFQARTPEYLDKAELQIRINNKVIGTSQINHRLAKPLQLFWQNKKETDITLSLHLLSYDGDGNEIACNVFDFQEVEHTQLTTSVNVRKDCNGCATPARPQVINISLNEIRLQWKEAEYPFIVRYRKTGEEDWQQTNGKGKSLLISGLSGTADYEAQAASICRKDTSKWCEPVLMLSSDRQLMAGR